MSSYESLGNYSESNTYTLCMTEWVVARLGQNRILYNDLSFSYMLLYLSLLYVKPQYAHYIIARLAVYIKDPCKQGTQKEKKIFLEFKESERKGLLYKN